MRKHPAKREINLVIFSLIIFFPQCSAVERKNTHKKQPSKMERQEKKAEIFVCMIVCAASSAPKTPVHQTIVIGLEMART